MERHVDRAVGVEGRLEHARDIVGVGDVSRDREATDLLSHGLGRLRVHVDDDDLGALGGEAQGRRTSDAASAASDECGAIGEPVHG